MSSFPVPPALSENERHHKRPRTVRRSTRSCSECRRRKIRCQLSSDKSITICLECIKRGTACVTQGYPMDKNSSPGGGKLGERLGRVETLLERLVEKEEGIAGPTQDAHQLSDTPESAVGFLTPYSSNGPNVQNAPVLSLFNNEVFGRREMPGQSAERPGVTMLGTGSAGRAPSKIEKLRQTLAALLPSQEDASLIAESTNGWVLLSVLCTPANDLYRNSDPTSSFNVVAVSQRGPTIIARTLLYIAICIQQLPPEFDTSRLQLKNFSVDALMDKYMSTVASLVTSNDELAGTMEGLECILLQGLFHINSGNLRRAWLSFRRGLTIAQLLGLQKAYLKPLDEVDLMTVMAMKMMWHKVIQSDRYLGVILGLPCGTGDDCFGDEEESLQGLNADNRDVFERRLCIIAGSINARNLKESSTKTYTVTQQLDEKMDRLSNEMSQSWWEIPVLAVVERSLAVSGQFDRLLAQLWFFQLKALLHLPFMLCAGTDRRYEYSKFSCLNASRELVLRYLALRRFGNTQLMCRVVDFAAFIGAIILILDQVGPPSPEAESPKTQQLRESDRSLIQNVITSMETVSHSNREVAARESVEVMKTLLASNTTSRNLRLTIPYFGTIRLLREQIPSQTSPNPEHLISSTLNAPQHPDVYGQNIEVEDWQGSQSVQNYRNIPVVSFESSQFASFDIDPSTENWDFADADQLIFNSLLNMDIGGDWIS